MTVCRRTRPSAPVEPGKKKMIRRTALTAGSSPSFSAFLVWTSLAGSATAATVRPWDSTRSSIPRRRLPGHLHRQSHERDPQTNLVVTYTTFAVEDVLKGTVPATHTIKQIGGNLAAEGTTLRVEGIPTFVVGQNYVVFLAGVSSAGFSSPIGLGQGRFSVRLDAGRHHGQARARRRPGSILLAPGPRISRDAWADELGRRSVRARERQMSALQRLAAAALLLFAATGVRRGLMSIATPADAVAYRQPRSTSTTTRAPASRTNAQANAIITSVALWTAQPPRSASAAAPTCPWT
jgi:hypothetical protein